MFFYLFPLKKYANNFYNEATFYEMGGVFDESYPCAQVRSCYGINEL